MSKIFNLAMSNIRKSKGQSISFLIIMTIAAMLLNIGLITAVNYTKNFDDKAKQLNSQDVAFSVQYDDAEFNANFTKQLEADNRVKAVESHPILFTSGEFMYADNKNGRYISLFDRSLDYDIGQFAMIDETDKVLENSIYLPYLFNIGGQFNIGDDYSIDFMLSDGTVEKIEFTIAGFYEDILFSTINSTTTGFLLNHDVFLKLEKHFENKISGRIYSIKTVSTDYNEAISTSFGLKLSEQLPVGKMHDSVHYQIMKAARTLTSSIGAMIVVGFAFILLVVSLIVANFRIKCSVEEEIKNIGALKAIGYTSSQLICSFIAQFTVITAIGSIIGITLSYPILPFVADMFAKQTGVFWKQSFSPSVTAATIIITVVMVLLVSMLSAMRIKKLHPIIALRTGITTHSFKRNYFAMDKTNLPLTFCLAFKQFLRNASQNIMIGIIIIGITFAACFACVFQYNFHVDNTAFLRVVTGITNDVLFTTPDSESAKKLYDEVQARSEIESLYYMSVENMQYEKNYEAITYISDEFEKVDNPDWLYKGRFPKHDNEIVIGCGVVDNTGKDVGDTIQLNYNNQDYEYIITGLIQSSNFLGRDMGMTTDAYRKINPDFAHTIIRATVNDSTNINDFISDMRDQSSNVTQSENNTERILSSMKTYTSIVSALVCIISVITVVMITLVMYLVIQTMLIHKKKELGIQKAIGFTTKQLIFQNALTFLPVIIIGTLIGCIVGYFLMNPFISVMFSGIGLVKVTFYLSIPMFIALFFAIVLFGFGVSLLLSSKIKRITPYALMSE